MSDRVVEPRLAATLLVLRQERSGWQVLMGRRNSMQRFMPNALVFPGGAVDPSDFEARIGRPLRPDVERLVMRGSDARAARAIAAAVARELEEETGLSLGRPPHLDGLDVLCRAITPSERPRRFDAYFFVVAAEALEGSPVSTPELENVGFVGVEDALAGELEFATRGALDKLQAWLPTRTSSSAHRTTIPVMREKIWYEE